MGEQLNEGKMTLREQIVQAICYGFQSASEDDIPIRLVVKDDETEIYVSDHEEPIRVIVDPPDVVIPESWPNREGIASGILLDVGVILAMNKMNAADE